MTNERLFFDDVKRFCLTEQNKIEWGDILMFGFLL